MKCKPKTQQRQFSLLYCFSWDCLLLMLLLSSTYTTGLEGWGGNSCSLMQFFIFEPSVRALQDTNYPKLLSSDSCRWPLQNEVVVAAVLPVGICQHRANPATDCLGFLLAVWSLMERNSSSHSWQELLLFTPRRKGWVAEECVLPVLMLVLDHQKSVSIQH